MMKTIDFKIVILFTLFLNIVFSGCNPSDNTEKDDSIESVNYIDGKVNNQGVELYYKLIGSGIDTLIFIHGTPSTMYAFAKDFENFSDYFTIIFYDQRGGGRSNLILDPDSLTWQENVSDLEAIRNHFRIINLNLMGVSWGSALAILYASQYPENVKSLILFPPRARKQPDIPKDAEPLPQTFDSLESSRINELLEMWEYSTNPDSICKEYWSIVAPKMFHNPESYNKFKGSFCQEPPEVLRYTWKVSDAKIQSLGDFDFRPLLAKIQVKSLVIKGRSTSMYPEWTEEWAAWLPNSRMLWIDNAGGFPWVEKPDLILDACKTILNGGWPEYSKKIDRKILEEKYNVSNKE